MKTRRLSRAVLSVVTAAALSSFVVGAVGVASTANAASKPAAAPQAAVKIQNFSYMPKTLRITTGTKVTWTNRDSTGHTVTFTGFGSGSLGQGRSYSHKFTTAGTFKYHCTFHSEMTAKVIVSG